MANTPERSRVELAMETIAIVPCWMPIPKTGSLPEGMPLLGSGRICLLENLIDSLLKEGFTQEEINSAVAEHKQWERLEFVAHGGIISVHANNSMLSWLQSQHAVCSRLIVKVAQELALLDGENILLPSRNVALFLHEIVKRRGGRVTSTEIIEACPELDGTRPDRLKTKLPGPIQALIASDTQGYRLKVEGLKKLA